MKQCPRNGSATGVAANIKVEPQRRMIYAFGKLQILCKLLDEEPRFRLDHQCHPTFCRHIEAGQNLVVKNIGGIFSALPYGQFAAWLGRDLCCTNFSR